MEVISGWTAALSSVTGLQPWVLAVFLIVLTAMLVDFIQRRLMKRFGQMVRSTENTWDDAIFHASIRPLSMLIWLIGLSAAASMLPLFAEGSEMGVGPLRAARQLGFLFAISWFLLLLTRNLEENYVEKAKRENRELDQTTVQALGRVFKITVVVTAILVSLDTMGFNVQGLMAAGGIGGLAIGFASKDLIANLFGGVTVFLDRPFGIGDWIILNEQNIEGTVEEHGLAPDDDP